MNDLTSSLMGASTLGGKDAPDPLDDMLRTRRDAAISQRVQQADADRQARVWQLARELDYPETLVGADLPAFEAKARSIRAQGVIGQYPAIGRWSADRDNAAIAADDYDNLGLFGKAFYGLKNFGGTLQAGTYQALGGIYGAVGGIAETIADISPETKALFGPIADAGLGIQKYDKAQADKARPNVENWVARNLLQGIESLPTTVAAIGASAATGNPGVGASIMGASVGGNEYANARDKGLSPGRSLIYGASQGAVEFVTEKIPVSRLVGDLATKSPLGKTLLRQVAAEVPGEQVATFLQDLNQWATLNPDKTLKQFVTERPSAAAETLVATLGGVGATVGLTTAVERTARVASKVVERRRDSEQAKANGAALDAIADAATRSKTAARAPEAVAELVQQLGEEVGADTAYISGEAAASYMQSDAYAGELDRWSDQIDEASALGGDVVIPIGDLATIAATPAWAALKEDMRLSAGGMSRREAQTFDDAMADVMDQLSERAASEAEAARKLGVPRDRLLQSIADKLMNAGFTPSSARQQAELLTQRQATRAARMGRELTGSELDDLQIRQVLPAKIAAAQKADQLDMTIDVMKRGLNPAQSLGPTLMDFIARGGGVVDTGGDLKAMGADAWHKGKPGKRKLIRDNSGAGQTSTLADGGLGVNEYSADAWAMRAWEAGYFPEFADRPTANDLLDAIAEGVAGRDRTLVAREKSVRDAAEELRALIETRGMDADTATRQEIRAAVDAYVSEQADGLGYDQAAPVASITGDEIAPADASDQELRKAAKDWFKNHLSGTSVYSAALGADVEFVGSGKKPISSSADVRKLRLFAALPQLVAQGAQVDTVPDKRGTRQVKAWHYLRGTVDLGGERIGVTLSVREETDGHFYYNHVVEGSAAPQRTGPAREAGGGSEGSAYDQSILNSGDNINMSLNAGDKQPRGRIVFPGGQSASAVIELFQSRDQSTFLHETGHLWLEELRTDAVDPEAPQQVRDDWQAVQDWFAANGHPLVDGVIPVDAHEMWARGVERYLMEGKAPSPALQRMFQTFKAWLVSLYNSVSRLRSPITDEVRGVMDRLIATDEELADAIAAQSLEALFPEKPAMMSADEFAAYQKTTAGARDAAHDALLAKVMNGIKRRVTAEYREKEAPIRADVTDSVDARPEYRALRLMKDTPIDSLWVREHYGEDATGLLPRQVPPVHKVGGANPDEIAEMAGFTTSDEMIRVLMGVEMRRRDMIAAGDTRSVRRALIEQEVNQLMLDRYGDPFTDGSIQEEALAAVHSDQMGEVIAAELRVLARSTGDRITPYSVAKAWAARQVREGEVRTVASRSAIVRYERAAAKAGRAAMEAVIAGDNVEAFRQKQSQMLNNALVAEAKRAADDVDAAVSRLEKWAKRRTVKSVDQDYLERAQALLEQVDMKPRSQRFIDRRDSFEAWAEAQEAAGHDIVVPRSFASSLGSTHWSRLSVEQLIGLDDAVKQIIHLGRLKQTLLDNQEEREFNAVVDEALAGMDGMKQRPPSDLMEPSRWDGIKSKVAAFDASLLKMEQVFDWLDGGNSNGVFNRIVFKPLADAQAREATMTADYHARIKAEFAKIEPKQLRRWSERFTASELINRETGRPYQMKREQLIAIALNMGNKGNIQRLTDGYGWAESSVQMVLNRELTPADWRFVQNVWDIIETLWPMSATMERRVNGVEPDKVEAQELVTPNGTLRGGYYPAIYDTSKSYVAEEHAGKGSDLLDTIYTRANTRASATRERSDQVKRPILLQIGVINRHMGEMIHDITHREAVMQADKFLRSERIMRAVDDTMGPEIRKQFRPWLKYIANSWAMERAGNEGVGAFMQKLRSNATIVGMGFRFTTMLTQLAGYSNSFEYVGAKWVSAAVAQATAHPIDSFNFVMEKSSEVRNRMDTLDRDIRVTLQGMQGKKEVITAAKRFAFHGIGYMDRVVVVPTWIGAYNKAQASGLDETASVYAADKAVRLSQGAGSPKDMAAIARGTGKWGEALKLMTMFYSYMSAFYQRQRTLGRDVMNVRRAGDVPGLLARAWWLIVLPPLMAQILGGRGPEDDEDWSLWAFKQMLFQSVGPIPGLRDLAPPVWQALAGDQPFDYQFTPMQRAFQTVVDVAKDARNIAEGEETRRPVRNALEMAGYWTGLVPGQVATSTQFLVDVGNGEQDPETFNEWYEGLTKGKIKD